AQWPQALEHRGLLDGHVDAGELSIEDPRGEGEVERGVDDDDRPVLVDPVNDDDLLVETDDQGNRREHLGDQYQVQEGTAAAEAIAGGEVGGWYGDDESQRRGRHRDDQAVAQ